MSKWKCNSCLEVYADRGTNPNAVPHVCQPFIIEHAVCDAEGKVITPETRTPREVVRNENALPGLYFEGGKPQLRIEVPNAEIRFQVITPDSLIISEGAGRAQVE